MKFAFFYCAQSNLIEKLPKQNQSLETACGLDHKPLPRKFIQTYPLIQKLQPFTSSSGAVSTQFSKCPRILRRLKFSNGVNTNSSQIIVKPNSLNKDGSPVPPKGVQGGGSNWPCYKGFYIFCTRPKRSQRRLPARRRFPLATQYPSCEGSSGVSRG